MQMREVPTEVDQLVDLDKQLSNLDPSHLGICLAHDMRNELIVKVPVAQKVVSCHTEEKLKRMLRERMDISNLWKAWPVSGPWHLSPLLGGTNNLMWRADAADGQSSV